MHIATVFGCAAAVCFIAAASGQVSTEEAYKRLAERQAAHAASKPTTRAVTTRPVASATTRPAHSLAAKPAVELGDPVTIADSGIQIRPPKGWEVTKDPNQYASYSFLSSDHQAGIDVALMPAET